jgi:hypothetical protein
LSSPTYSSSIFPAVEAYSECKSEIRGTISFSELRTARFSALEIADSKLLIVTRTETPDDWLISLDARASNVICARMSFMNCGIRTSTPERGG